MAETTIPENAFTTFVDALDKANTAVAAQFPGESPRRQPVHTVYGGAHLFKADTAQKLGGWRCARSTSTRRTRATFAAAIGMPIRARWHVVYAARARRSCEREPVEDFRIDFEDGFGNRPDAEEDGHASSAARRSGGGAGGGHAAAVHRHPHQAAQRGAEARAACARSISSSTRCSSRPAARLPPNFVVTLPKITIAGAGRGAGVGCATRSRTGAGCRRHAALRADDRDDAVDLRARTAASQLPRFVAAGARPHRRRALRHLRLHRRLQHHRRAPAHAPSGVRFRQAHDAGGATPAPASGCPTARPTSCRSAASRTR